MVHRGHAYGFDGSGIACIDLKDGNRKWKGGRYGNGQLVLLSDQDLLLVVSEQGELALVKATPDGFTELARFQAIKGGGYPYFVAELDGRIAGYAYASAYRTRPGYRFTVENSVYIAPDAQGKGIGRVLLDKVITTAATTASA